MSYIWHLHGRSCDLATLRQSNTVALAGGVLLPTFWLFIYRNEARGKVGTLWINTTVDRDVMRALHTALNVCLFPPFFFFSGLYYTDVMSTACVLTFLALRESEYLGARRVFRGFVLTVVGLVALSFRQTNIFWVAVFPAALEAVSLLKSISLHGSLSETASMKAANSWTEFLQASWQRGTIYDPPFDETYVEGE